METKKINFENVGKRCPLCEEGLIVYVNIKGGFTQQYEFIGCSNEKCKGAIKIKHGN